MREEEAAATGHCARKVSRHINASSQIGPELSRTFEATLILSAGSFNGSRCPWLAALFGRPIIQPIRGCVRKYSNSLCAAGTTLGSQALGHLLQFSDHADRAASFELLSNGSIHWRAANSSSDVSMRYCPQVLAGMIKSSRWLACAKRSCTKFQIHMAPSAMTKTLPPCPGLGAGTPQTVVPQATTPWRVITVARLKMIERPLWL